MGIDKATLPHAGSTFLEHAIARLQSICSDVVVSGQTSTVHHWVAIKDRIDRQGPVVGIASALWYAREHRFDGCLVTPVDTPSLAVGDLEKLLNRWLIDGELTVAHSDRIEPLIGIYPVALTDDLDRLARSKDRSLYRWIDSQDHTSLPFPAVRTRNINTPEDLSQYGC